MEDKWTDPKFEQPNGSGNLVSKIVAEWVQDRISGSSEQIVYIDSEPWPSNLGCSGKQSLRK